MNEKWRNLSIIAQTAAKVAGEILSAEGKTPDIADFLTWQEAIYDNTLQLVGGMPEEEEAPRSQPQGHQQQQQSHDAQPKGDRPYSGVEVKFGKFRGLTIGEIDEAVSDDGKTGHSWLVWAADNLDEKNEFIRKAIRSFLGK